MVKSGVVEDEGPFEDILNAKVSCGDCEKAKGSARAMNIETCKKW